MKNSPTVTIGAEDLVLCNNTTIEAYFTGVPSGWTAGALPGGNFTHGSTFEITGTGFGTKATAEPLVYDDFESGATGSNIFGQAPAERAIGGSWTWDMFQSGAETHQPVYSDSVLRANSTRSAYLEYPQAGQSNGSLEIWHPLANTGDEIYFSFWQHYDNPTDVWSRNFKPWVVYGTGAGVYPSSYVGFGNPDQGDGGLRNAVQDVGHTEQTLWSSLNIAEVKGKWVRWEFFLKQSSPSVTDGKWVNTLHIPDDNSITELENEQAYATRSSSDYWTQWHFGSYHDNTDPDTRADIYITDLYFDSTQQRVELGNAATWAACTKREVQVAKSWTDTSITITANAGSFANSDTAYLYIVNADGTRVSESGISVEVSI